MDTPPARPPSASSTPAAPAASRPSGLPALRRRAGEVLVTGFGPFGGVDFNPSGQVAQALDGQVVAGVSVSGVVLPTEFGRSVRELEAALATTRPRLVLALGVAPSRAVISVERVAINVDDARIPDNAGRQPIDTPIAVGGPAAYFSRLPVKAMAAVLREAGHAAEVSQTAGTFVCNHVFYGLMHALRRRRGVRAGFVHVPPVNGAGPELDALVAAVRLAIEVALTTARDRLEVGGQVD